jgi:hypothetical protein
MWRTNLLGQFSKISYTLIAMPNFVNPASRDIAVTKIVKANIILCYEVFQLCGGENREEGSTLGHGASPKRRC